MITACAALPRPDQDGTWITPSLLQAYVKYHRQGRAHSAEAWLDDQLVGGIYGVDSGGAFSGESMFYVAPNASKLALLHLVDHLRSRGIDWMDIQMVTPHMKALGAVELPRETFLARLAETRARGLRLFP